MIDTSIFRERFIQLREEHQMSQAQFAVFLGIPSGSVGGYENGTKFPNGKTLFTIATKCGVSADYLLGLHNNPVLNEDIQMICNYTGLDEHVLKIMHNHSNNKQYMRFVETNILSTAIILDDEKE